MDSIPDDRQLAARVIDAGDEGAFRTLYDRHTPRLLRCVLRLLGNSDVAAAEDIVQEAWIRAAARLGAFEWRSRFETWLTGISLNVARETLRRERRHDLIETAPADPVARSHNAPHLVDLDRAIARLSEGRRTVLILHDLQGFTHDEIASLLGIAAGTSKSQLHDARREVERYLTEGTNDERPTKR